MSNAKTSLLSTVAGFSFDDFGSDGSLALVAANGKWAWVKPVVVALYSESVVRVELELSDNSEGEIPEAVTAVVDALFSREFDVDYSVELTDEENFNAATALYNRFLSGDYAPFNDGTPCDPEGAAKKFYATWDAAPGGNGKIAENAAIREFDTEEAAREYLLKGFDDADRPYAEIGAGSFGDCWLKSGHALDADAFAPFTVDQVNEQSPGQHPDGNAFWYTPAVDILTVVFFDRDAAMLDARSAAEKAEEKEDKTLRLDYSNALIGLDNITVSGSTTADVQKAFDELVTAAFENPFGQDVIHEAKEVLEGTQWQLDDDCARIIERSTSPEGPEGDDNKESDARLEAEVYCDDSVLGVGEHRALLRVQLSEEGRLTVEADEKHSSENTVSSDVWHRRTLEWTADLSDGDAVVVDKDALEALAKEVAPLAAVVHAGHSVDWHGGNRVGELSDAADEAFCAIALLVDNAEWLSDVTVWDAEDWVSDGIGHLGITSSTTDEELQDIADSLYRDAESERHRLCGDVYPILERHREGLRDGDVDQDETLAA